MKKLDFCVPTNTNLGERTKWLDYVMQKYEHEQKQERLAKACERGRKRWRAVAALRCDTRQHREEKATQEKIKANREM